MSKKYKNLKTGVIGVGSMGQNHARVYNEISNLVAVSDLNFEHGKEISERFDTNFFEDYRDMFPEVDAISVAVPTSLHLDVACSALQAGVHVLVEKPLAASIEESKNIIRTAKKFERVLSVGHIERHNPVVQYLCLAISESYSSFQPRSRPSGERVSLTTSASDLSRRRHPRYLRKITTRG